MNTSVSSSLCLHRSFCSPLATGRSQPPGYGSSLRNPGTIRFGGWGSWFTVRSSAPLSGSCWSRLLSGLFYIRTALLALETVDLVDQQVDLIVLCLHLWLQFRVAFLHLRQLFGFGLCHHSSFLVETLDFTAKDNDFECEFIGEGFLLFKLLLIALKPPFVPLYISC